MADSHFHPGYCNLMQAQRMPQRSFRADTCEKEGFIAECCMHDAAQALDEMQVQGHRPDVGIYNIALEVLTRSGVLSAQLKAAQLFQTATRQGQLRCGIWTRPSVGAELLLMSW